MLSELSGLAKSDEEVWGTPEICFTITTRSKEDELIERRYTFSRAPEWEQWNFYRFEERRTPDTDRIDARRWRREKDIYWDDGGSDVSIPPSVSAKIEELLSIDELVLRK